MSEQPQGNALEEVAAVAALTALVAGPPAAATSVLLLLLRILRPFGIGKSAAWTAWKIARSVRAPVRRPSDGPGRAWKAARVDEHRYRAAYLLNAATRIQGGINTGADLNSVLRREQAYAEAHRRASINRLEVAAAVDSQAQLWGPILGWHAVLDDRTSADCRRAHGKNFRADQRPRIGWPGSVHPHCRCAPGAPWPTRRLVDGGQLPQARRGPRIRAGARV